MIATPEDQRVADVYAQDQEEQQDLFKDLDQMDEQDGANSPADTADLAASQDAEFAADEKIRQREELLEESK